MLECLELAIPETTLGFSDNESISKNGKSGLDPTAETDLTVTVSLQLGPRSGVLNVLAHQNPVQRFSPLKTFV